MGSDHSPVHLELHIGGNEVRKTTFKWNVSHLKDEILDKLEEKWVGLPRDVHFFHKIIIVSRCYRQMRKEKTKATRKLELDTMARLEIATTILHEDIGNFEKQGEVSKLRHMMEGINTRKAKWASIRVRSKWQQVGNKCSKEFFKAVRQKNIRAIIVELKDRQGKNFIKINDLERICLDFYNDLYNHKEIIDEALIKVMKGLPALFTAAMNKALDQEITKKELRSVTNAMAKGKAPGHDGIPIEFFQKFWPTIGQDFHRMIVTSIEEGKLHDGITKGLISLIPKEGDNKDLNYWRPTALLTVSYKIFAKTLQLRLQPMLRDVVSPEQTIFLPLRLILDNTVLT